MNKYLFIILLNCTLFSNAQNDAIKFKLYNDKEYIYSISHFEEMRNYCTLFVDSLVQSISIINDNESSIPFEVFEYSQLQELELSMPLLRVLSDSIYLLTELKIFYCECQLNNGMPNSIILLKKLTDVSLMRTNFLNPPNVLFDLENINYLYLDTHLTTSNLKLKSKSLTNLNLNCHQSSRTALDLRGIPNLTSLIISNDTSIVFRLKTGDVPVRHLYLNDILINKKNIKDINKIGSIEQISISTSQSKIPNRIRILKDFENLDLTIYSDEYSESQIEQLKKNLPNADIKIIQSNYGIK